MSNDAPPDTATEIMGDMLRLGRELAPPPPLRSRPGPIPQHIFDSIVDRAQLGAPDALDSSVVDRARLLDRAAARAAARAKSKPSPSQALDNARAEGRAEALREMLDWLETIHVDLQPGASAELLSNIYRAKINAMHLPPEQGG